MQTSRPRRAHSGMSTIEVVFSILIVAMAVLVYGSSLTLGRLIKSARFQNIAYRIGSKEMEDLRAISFASLPITGVVSNGDLASLPSGTAQRTVTDVNPKLKQVTVTVSWTETGGTKTVRLDTLIYERGINSL